jgi:microcin C transport system substrate-binding protein
MSWEADVRILLILLLCLWTGAAQAAELVRTHGLALVGTPALPPDFPHFPYVKPDAPKGGEVATAGLGTFDSFNPFIVRGTPAASAARVFESLMTRSADEPETAYGHIAAVIELPEDRKGVAFELRPEARFHDGTKITAEDVVWTFNTLREKGRPFYRQYYADVASVTAEGPLRVVFRFTNDQNRELAQILGEMPVLPKHWWASRDFTKPLTEPPLGSGAYRVASFEMGRTLVLERVPDYWGAKLPTAKGLANFDRIRTEYYRDATVAQEAFKAGQVDWRIENIAKEWATGYDFPAVAKGLVRKESLKRNLPTGMQGFAMNTRRPLFQNRLVREALVQLFDFEWMNRNLFYGQYERTLSYYSNSDFASSGLPLGAELALLEPYRAKLPAAVFDKNFTLPVTDGSGNNREGLRRALALFKEAGWEVRDRKLVNAQGTRFAFEILLSSPTYERIALPYVQWLERSGIEVRVRTVDPAQYQRLMDSFDFDMTDTVFGQSGSPGNEQLEFWGCTAAKAEGSANTMGVCNEVVEALIANLLRTSDHASQVTAVRALDRVLLNQHFIVPQWHSDKVNIAYWDRFGRPSAPVRSGVVIDSWWIDPARAAVTDAARRMAP